MQSMRFYEQYGKILCPLRRSFAFPPIRTESKSSAESTGAAKQCTRPPGGTKTPTTGPGPKAAAKCAPSRTRQCSTPAAKYEDRKSVV